MLVTVPAWHIFTLVPHDPFTSVFGGVEGVVASPRAIRSAMSFAPSARVYMRTSSIDPEKKFSDEASLPTTAVFASAEIVEDGMGVIPPEVPSIYTLSCDPLKTSA
jgi:hypothetical protein